MQVLVYGSRKTEYVDKIWDATGENENKAFLALFNYFDKDWEFYDVNDMTAPQKKLYHEAVEGNGASAKKLLTVRRSYEYEDWYLVDVKNP